MIDTLSRKRLVDKLIEAYVDWPELYAQVNDSYRSCASDAGAGDGAAFGLYMAALDAEEQAAEVYARLVQHASKLPWSEEPAPESRGPAWRAGRP